MNKSTLAKRLRSIQRRNFNRIQFQTESCRIRARLELESMTDYERIAWFLICPDCYEPRISLKAALCLAASARTVPAWRHFVDVQESLYAEIEGMNAMGPHQ